MAKLSYSLRDLYRTLEEPGANPLRDAHAKLDSAVRAAYGMKVARHSDVGTRTSPGSASSTDPTSECRATRSLDDGDILQFLLDLNHACAAKEKAGEKITPPGLPLPPEEHAKFITEDCISV
jgi:hypothetical protein